MSTSLKQIEEQARALSAEDRAKLAESLLESLTHGVSHDEAREPPDGILVVAVAHHSRRPEYWHHRVHEVAGSVY